MTEPVWSGEDPNHRALRSLLEKHGLMAFLSAFVDNELWPSELREWHLGDLHGILKTAPAAKLRQLLQDVQTVQAGQARSQSALPHTFAYFGRRASDACCDFARAQATSRSAGAAVAQGRRRKGMNRKGRLLALRQTSI